MSQQELFVETIYEALDAIVKGTGGLKKVGSELWPSMATDKAGRELADCLNPSHVRKLDLEEVMWLLRRGRECNVHVGINFISESCGYAAPTPIDHESEKQKLQREFVDGVDRLERLADRIREQSSTVSRLDDYIQTSKKVSETVSAFQARQRRFGK